MNQFNALHGDEPTEPPREWNCQPPAAHFKSRTSPTKTSPLVSAIMGRLNHNTVDNDDVEVHPTEFQFQSNSESVPDPDTTPIKSINDDEMGHVTGVSVHAPWQRNSKCVQTVRRSIYKTRWTKHTHSPILHYKKFPQVPTLSVPGTWNPDRKRPNLCYSYIYD